MREARKLVGEIEKQWFRATISVSVSENQPSSYGQFSFPKSRNPYNNH